MNMKYRIPAIVLGLSVNGLGVIRSLARNGVKVYAMDSDEDNPSMRTRYATCLICPDVRKNPEAFKQFLLDLTQKIGGQAVLFPTGDNFNGFVHQYRHQLKGALKFNMPDGPVMAKLLNKKGQWELAQEHGVPVPRTFFPQTSERVKILARQIIYPVLLKGLSTGDWRQKFGDQKAVIANDAQELIEAYASIHFLGHIDPVVQEVIGGDDTRHFKICAYFNREGTPLLTFTLQKIRQYPCDFGIGSSVKSIREPEVARLGLEFMKKIGYKGVGSIEFKKDKRDEEWKMIEVNPRLWAQNSLPEACGQNFAFTAYLDMLGEKVEPKTDFTEGIKWIAFNADRSSFSGYRKQGRMTWAQWLKSILTGPRVWAVWAWDDPMPFLASIHFGLLPVKKILIKLTKLSSGSIDNLNVSKRELPANNSLGLRGR